MTTVNWYLFSAILIVGICIIQAKLPSYVNTCSLSDPNLEKCMLDSSMRVIENIKNGDKEYKIPSITPLLVNEIKLQPSDTMEIKLKDIAIMGLDTAEPYKIVHDVDNMQLTVKYKIPLINFTGTYEIKGRILVLPIEGNGYLEIDAEDGDYDQVGTYELMDKNGAKYVKFSQDKSKIDMNFGNMKFRLDNLFNGDQTLGKEMNKFLNENWKEASKEFLPAFSQVMKIIMFDILNHIASEVSYDELFLP